MPPRRAALGCLIFLFIAATILFFARTPLLRLSARLWIVDDSPATAADIIIIPGGQIATRPPKAAELFQAGLAPGIFVMRETENPILHRDTPGSERAEFVSTVLIAGGVPENALVFSEDRVSSTWEEAGQFALWVDSLNPEDRPKSAIIVTDAFHSRRARWAYSKQSANSEISFQVVAVPHRIYRIDHWWEHEYGRSDFLLECKKLLYYWIFL